MRMVRAFIGFGSNLGDRSHFVEEALRRLDQTPGVRLLRRSRVRETDPVGGPPQPRFLNGVAEIETTLDARSLLRRLLEIEAELGRARGAAVSRWGPRVIDLDLLLFGDQRIQEADLRVPHPRISEREFVLTPLEDLEPRLAQAFRNSPGLPGSETSPRRSGCPGPAAGCPP